MNEQELNKKLAEWAGLCWHDWEWEAFERFWDTEAQRNTWNGKCKGCGVSVVAVTDFGKRTEQGFGYDKLNFTQSLDACLTQLVPDHDITCIMFIYADDEVICKVEVAWSKEYEGTAELGKDALALCLAISKLIDRLPEPEKRI